MSPRLQKTACLPKDYDIHERHDSLKLTSRCMFGAESLVCKIPLYGIGCLAEMGKLDLKSADSERW